VTRSFLLPEQLLTTIDLYGLPGARVVWFDTTALSSPDAILERHAYAIPSPFDSGGLGYDSRQAVGFADKYGSTSGLAPHGGAGRAGIVNGLYVKGIGPTPLIGETADALHSHGCLWLEEAIRELVFSRLAHIILGSSAGTVHAVVDTGIDATVSGVRRRRALLVRDVSLRAAHLQRALLYSPTTLFHVHDVERVTAARRCALECTATKDITEFCRRLARRAGRTVARCHSRMFFQGGLTSGNLDVDGSLIDFGGARFVPTFQPLTYETRGQFFGQELASAYKLLASLTGSVGDLRAETQSEDNYCQIQQELTRTYKAEAAQAIPWLRIGEGQTICAALLDRGYAPSEMMALLLNDLSRESVQGAVEYLIREEGSLGIRTDDLINQLSLKVSLLEKLWTSEWNVTEA